MPRCDSDGDLCRPTVSSVANVPDTVVAVGTGEEERGRIGDAFDVPPLVLFEAERIRSSAHLTDGGLYGDVVDEPTLRQGGTLDLQRHRPILCPRGPLAFMSKAIIVVGCGSIGERHLRNLRSLGEQQLHVVDPVDEARARAEALGATTHRSLDSALAVEPRAVLVCTPPFDHVHSARAAISAGAHVFVEKPISHDLEGVAPAISEAAAKGLVFAVGYNLRFHPGLRKVKDLVGSGTIGRLLSVRAEFGQELSSWRPARDYRDTYSARDALGGGILLDASHEIDYVRWLGGELTDVAAVTGRLSALEIDVEDTAALVMRLASGALAEIHLDCIQVGYARSCKLIGSAGTVVWDWNEGVELITAKTRAHFAIDADANAMYVDELKHFLSCIDGGGTPLVSGEDGLRALEVVIAAKRSSAEGRTIAL